MVLDKKEIEKEAKQILDKFASALAKVENRRETQVSLTSHPSLDYVDRNEFERVEIRSSSENKFSENGENADKSVNSFKKKILENAPEHDDDFIIVEKGKWKS